jgi:hypothetical protein
VAPSLLLAGCGAPTLALSDDPVTKAAQCGVVAASFARTAQKDVKATLPFDARVRVLHYALLAATEGGGYDMTRAAEVLKTLPEVEPEVTGGKWQPLGPACELAFGETTAPPRLPANPLEAQLGCSQLADYVEGALQSQETTYAEALQPIHAMRLALDNRIGAKMQSAGKTDLVDQKRPRDKAMNAIVHAGAAAETLRQCVRRFS